MADQNYFDVVSVWNNVFKPLVYGRDNQLVNNSDAFERIERRLHFRYPDDMPEIEEPATLV